MIRRANVYGFEEAGGHRAEVRLQHARVLHSTGLHGTAGGASAAADAWMAAHGHGVGPYREPPDVAALDDASPHI